VAEPITVIGLLMEVLEDDLYAVDLDRLSIVPGRNVSLRRSAARLSELGGNAYVLARGLFQMDTAGDLSGRTTTFPDAVRPAGDLRASPRTAGTLRQHRPARRRPRRTVLRPLPRHRAGLGPLVRPADREPAGHLPQTASPTRRTPAGSPEVWQTARHG
jgi:hypothetical protein